MSGPQRSRRPARPVVAEVPLRLQFEPRARESRRTKLLSSRGEKLIITSEGAEPAWFGPTVQALSELLKLSSGWNSYGARPVDIGLVRSALELMAATMRPDTPPPSVVPTSRGGVQLEWHLGGIDLEVEVLAPGHFSVAYEDSGDGDDWEAELRGSDLKVLEEALDKLAQRS